MQKIDKFDLMILKELISNSKISLTKLSKKINKSKSFVKYRIEKLEKHKIIKKYVVAVRWNLLGFFSFRILAKGIENIKIPRIFGLRWYEKFYDGYEFLMLSYNYKNLLFLINYLREHGFDTDIFVRTSVIVPPNFLGVKIKEFPIKYKIEIDKNWFWNFLVNYEKNIRKPLLKLSYDLNIEYYKLRSIINQFENSIFRGYSIIVDPGKLGYQRAIIYVSVKKNKEFLEKIRQLEVNSMERLLGKFDYRIEVYYSKDLRKLLNELEDLIKNLKVIKL
jgi:DNA-binding Lrp family transcriptional regulator